jgi:hypothetical protein
MAAESQPSQGLRAGPAAVVSRLDPLKEIDRSQW